MREPDPQWRELAQLSFAPFIDPNVFRYRAHEVRRIIAQAEALPQSPWIVEIGSNRGRFLTGLSAGHPKAYVLGVEIKRSLCDVARKRLARTGCDNGHVIHGDARVVMPILFHGARALQGLYVLFPDPWWKERHAKRRLLDDAFVRMVHALLEPDGHFVVMTDVGPYAEAFTEVLEEVALFDRVSREDIEGEETWVLTTRERYCERDGLPVHRFYLKPRG